MEPALRDLYEQAKKHFGNHDYAAARVLLEQICEVRQDYAHVYHMLGVVLHDAGLFSKAQAAFERALNINPRYTEAALNLSVLYNDLGKYAQARETYGRALAYCQAEPNGMDPFVSGRIANMHADIADAYRHAGVLDEACAQLRQALQLRPLFADLRLRLANLLIEQNKHHEAIVELQRAVQDRPEHSGARVQLGLCYYTMGQQDEAIRHWQHVLAQQPEHAPAAMYLRMAGVVPHDASLAGTTS